MLEPVDDQQVGLEVDRPCGRGVEREERRAGGGRRARPRPAPRAGRARRRRATSARRARSRPGRRRSGSRRRRRRGSARSRSCRRGSRSSSTPACASPASASSASGSAPTAPIMRTRAPSFAAATAWFAPLPPGKRSKLEPGTVSPARGSRSTRATRSRLIDPTTVSSTRDRARVRRRSRAGRRARGRAGSRAGRTGPPRASRGRWSDCHRTCEASPSSARTSTASSRYAAATRCGGDLHAGAVEHRLPVDELRAARLAEPRPALGRVGLELEQVAAERPLEPGERRLDAVGGAAERRLATAGRARVGVAPRPPLEQPAERERRDLDAPAAARSAGAPSRSSTACSSITAAHSGREASVAHTSTTTGRIIGRRRVRS